MGGRALVPAPVALRLLRVIARTPLPDGTCAGPYTDPSEDYCALGAEVTPANLVEVTTAAATDTGRLGEVFCETAGGMRVPTRLHDSQLNTDCDPETFSDSAQTGICVLTNAW